MKILKYTLKIIGFIVLFFVLVGIFYSGVWYYQFEIKPGKELEAFTGQHLKYPLVDGQLTIPSERFDKFSTISDIERDSILRDSTVRRQVVSLNGLWEIAESSENKLPAIYYRKAPVPGFADQSEPAFEKVGETELDIFRLLFNPSGYFANIRFEDPNRQFFWYKRTFKLPGEVPQTAFIKVHRAQYGSEIWINGQHVGNNTRNYQPGKFNVTSFLNGNGMDNEVVVRVGTSINSKSKTDKNVFGDTMEKQKHLPGIYDNVELILSGHVIIQKVQVVPHLEDSTAQVVAWVKNYGTKDSISLDFKILKYKTDEIVGQVITNKFLIGEGEEKLVDVTIPIKNCLLWSPETPNLYMLKSQSKDDELNTRFGMREFCFDPETKVPMLNGRPYYLRGTNIPFFRYLDNPYRGSEVWDEKWIRTVYSRFKELNWNSLRFHVGPAPSLWYQIADEEGIFVQDEYAIWGWKVFRDGVTLDTLVSEYVGWMEEQWNHASVLIWDAQNETTVEPRSGYGLQIVRKIDLSNRPWDNGWDVSYEDTDTWESHPYIHNGATMLLPWQDVPDFSLSVFNDYDINEPYLHEGKPIMVNEYSWTWVNREGNPTLLTQNIYDHFFADASPEERFEISAYDCAAQTEYYRAIRAAGVQQFSGLSSNHDDSKTTDIFLESKNLTVVPQYSSYFRNAFSPLGICIFDWSDGYRAGEKVKLPIVLINDTYDDWEGDVVISLSHGDTVVSNHIIAGRVAQTQREILYTSIKIPSGANEYKLSASLTTNRGEVVKSIRKYKMLN